MVALFSPPAPTTATVTAWKSLKYTSVVRRVDFVAETALRSGDVRKRMQSFDGIGTSDAINWRCATATTLLDAWFRPKKSYDGVYHSTLPTNLNLYSHMTTSTHTSLNDLKQYTLVWLLTWDTLVNIESIAVFYSHRGKTFTLVDMKLIKISSFNIYPIRSGISAKSAWTSNNFTALIAFDDSQVHCDEPAIYTKTLNGRTLLQIG